MVGGGAVVDGDSAKDPVFPAGATAVVPPGGTVTACGNGGPPSITGGRQHAGVVGGVGVVSSSWNWERRAGEGVSFGDFFETFAGGGDEDVGEVGHVREQDFS